MCVSECVCGWMRGCVGGCVGVCAYEWLGSWVDACVCVFACVGALMYIDLYAPTEGTRGGATTGSAYTANRRSNARCMLPVNGKFCSREHWKEEALGTKYGGQTEFNLTELFSLYSESTQNTKGNIKG